MKILGPERYSLTFDSTAFTVLCSRGRPKFSGLATRRKPKLYVVSVDGRLIYVGITRQTMGTRFRFGFKAKGENGYHGYAWRHNLNLAVLDIWCHEDAPTLNADRDMETVEAEVVFLARLANQWPEGQTEIHFHPSNETHRELAKTIWRYVTSASIGK
jgi:hypothetical protein